MKQLPENSSHGKYQSADDPGQVSPPAGAPLWSRRRVLSLTAGALLLAGCGRRGAAAPEPATPSAATATPAATRRAVSAGAERTVTGPNSAAFARTPDAPVLVPTATPVAPLLPHRMVIPRIDLDIPVVELGWSTNRGHSGAIFSEWDVAAHAAGWHKNSALPGQAGNIVMSGHNNILGAVFRQLDQLRREDEISVYMGDDLHIYHVERVVIVPEKYADEEQRTANAQWIAPTPYERLTLVSCWPRNDNTHRIIVVARPDGAAG